MNQKTDPPNEYTFGDDFDYAKWTADTVITLVNVPWGNDYRDVCEMTPAQLDTWIDRQTTEKLTIDKMNYVRPGDPVRIDVPFNTANRYNYIRVSNPKQPVDGDTKMNYYFFVLGMDRKAPNTTEISVQLDVWATYRHLINFERGFVERGHIGVANSQSDVDNGRRWLTAPEGLDTGSDYEIVDERSIWKSTASNSHVLITSTVDLASPPGTVDNPHMESAPGGAVQVIPTATTTYAIHWNNIAQYFAQMKAYPWITQGIIKVTLAPRLTDFGYTFTPVARKDNYPPGPSGSNSSYLNKIDSYSLTKSVPFDPDMLRGLAMANVPSRFRGLTKFGVAPYTYLEVSNLNGSSVTFRPELFMQGTNTALVALSIIPGGERIEFLPSFYNVKNGGGAGEKYDSALVTGNLPNLPVLNDMAISALASTAHGRSAARASADWSQELAIAANANAFNGTLASAENSYGNEKIMRELGSQLMGMDQGVARTNQIYDSITSAVGGMGAGGAMGGGAGAAIGAAGGALKGVLDYQKLMRMQELDRNKLAASNLASGNVSARNFNTTIGIADSNYNLSDWAAKGNYAQAIGAMNARVQDTRLTQPSLSGGFGGEFLRYMAEGFTFLSRVRMIDQASIRRVGDYWTRYGYSMLTFMKLPANLLVMNKFSYWKLSEVYTSPAPVPELYKRALAGIMEKGVTVWANPDDIGRIDPTINTPKPGVVIER